MRHQASFFVSCFYLLRNQIFFIRQIFVVFSVPIIFQKASSVLFPIKTYQKKIKVKVGLSKEHFVFESIIVTHFVIQKLVNRIVKSPSCLAFFLNSFGLLLISDQLSWGKQLLLWCRIVRIVIHVSPRNQTVTDVRQLQDIRNQ